MKNLQSHIEHVIQSERNDIGSQAGHWPADAPYYIDRVREKWVRVTVRNPDTKDESTAWYRDVDGDAFVVRTASQIYPECSRDTLASVLVMALSPPEASRIS